MGGGFLVCVGAGFGERVGASGPSVGPFPPPPLVDTPPVNSLQETPAAPPSLAAEARQDGPRTPNEHFFKMSLAFHTPTKNSKENTLEFWAGGRKMRDMLGSDAGALDRPTQDRPPP